MEDTPPGGNLHPEGGVFSNSTLMVEGLKLKWVYPNKKTSRISLQKKLTDLESGQVLTLILREF